MYNGVAEIINSSDKFDEWRQLLVEKSCSDVMRLSLKYGLRPNNPSNVSQIKFLVALCGKVFTAEDVSETSEFFNLAISHSDFIGVMLDNSDVKCK